MENIANQISAAAAIIVFLIFIIYRYPKKIILSDIVMVVIAGGMLPIAIGFTLYPFFPSFLGSIEQMSLQITLTGIVLLVVYIKTIIEKMKSDSS